MMRTIRARIMMAGVALLLCASPVVATLVFNDGGVHDIDYAINEPVRVDYAAPGSQTTVNFLEGGAIHSSVPGMLMVYEDGRVNILGGLLGAGGFWTYDRSEVEVVSGHIDGALSLRNSSHVVFTGGSIGRNIDARDSSQVDFYGGSATLRVTAWHHSKINMFGGSVGHDLIASDSSQVNIAGGVIGPQLWAEDTAQVSLSGGVIEQYIVANDSSTITVYGSEFNYGYGQIPDSAGRLTGILASGETIDNTFYIKDNARIILVPEPASLLLLGLGGLFLRRRR